jgi:hypothetical protein
MNCSRRKKSLLLHAHGQLEGIPRRRMEYHLRRCAACRAQCSAWQQESRLWRTALAGEVELNGSAARLQSAVAERIRSEPRPARSEWASGRVGEWVRSRITNSPTHQLARLLVLAALLALALNALAAFGPPLGARVSRLWQKITARSPNCDQPPPVNRTPPGGTEDPGGGRR